MPLMNGIPKLGSAPYFVDSGVAKVIDNIRMCTGTGRPAGSDLFIKRLGKILRRDLRAKPVGRPRKKKK